MEDVGGPHKQQCDDVVEDHLVVVLSGLLELQREDAGLLGPECSLAEVEHLEQEGVVDVWVGLVHGVGSEEPQVGVVHDVNAEWAGQTVVEDVEELLDDTLASVSGRDAEPAGYRAEHHVEHELAQKREEDHVEEHEGEVLDALGVHVGVADAVGYGDVLVQRVGLGGVPGGEVRAVGEDEDDERGDPGVAVVHLSEREPHLLDDVDVVAALVSEPLEPLLRPVARLARLVHGSETRDGVSQIDGADGRRPS